MHLRQNLRMSKKIQVTYEIQMKRQQLKKRIASSVDSQLGTWILKKKTIEPSRTEITQLEI